jgi:hypothetical protein
MVLVVVIADMAITDVMAIMLMIIMVCMITGEHGHSTPILI